MSFILDALKKSETERRRQTAPGVADVAAPARRTGLPWWSVVLGILLGVNLLVLGIYLLRRSPPAPPPGAAELRPTAPAAARAAKPFSPLDPAATEAPEIPLDNPGAAPATTSRLPPAAGPEPAEAAASAPRTPENPTIPGTEDEPIPTIFDLTASGRQGLPEMHLDIHVYATKAADRFVFINNRKYREGTRTEEGPTIERITPDGVVMNYRGLRFLLPRQ